MSDQEIKSARRKVEEKWHSKLSGEASSEDFRQAYYVISQNLIEHLSAADGRKHLLEG